MGEWCWVEIYKNGYVLKKFWNITGASVLVPLILALAVAFWNAYIRTFGVAKFTWHHASKAIPAMIIIVLSVFWLMRRFSRLPAKGSAHEMGKLLGERAMRELASQRKKKEDTDNDNVGEHDHEADKAERNHELVMAGREKQQELVAKTEYLAKVSALDLSVHLFWVKITPRMVESVIGRYFVVMPLAVKLFSQFVNST